MTIIKIVSRWDSSKVLFSGEADSLRDLVVKAAASGAKLSGANLRDADLSGAKNDPSWLDPIRTDVWRILDEAPGEVAGLLAAVREGRIDGSAYRGECACLVGTIANVRKVDVDKCGIALNSDCPAERFFVRLSPGQTPDNSSDSAIVEGWILRWMAERQESPPKMPADFGPGATRRRRAKKPAAKKRAARKVAAR